MEVGIAGAGIAGLMTALALCAAGRQWTTDVRCHLIERSPTPGEAGAGIQISPNGCAVFDRLGLLGSLIEISSAPSAIRIVTADNQRCHVSVPLGQVAEERYGYPYLTVNRQQLHGLLMSQVDSLGECATMQFDAEINQVRDEPDRAWLAMTNGQKRSFDLVVGADGIHSCVRDVVGKPDTPRFTGHVAWRGIVSPDSIPECSLIRETVTSWMASGGHAVTYPLGDGRINLVVVEASQDWQHESWTVRGDAQTLLKRVDRWHTELRELVASMTEVYRWALFNRPVPAQWHGDRVVLVGDSCHAMPPYAAQGAVMAAEDAMMLAQALTTTVQSGSPRQKPFFSALADYQRQRFDRVRRVQTLAHRHGRLFHLKPLASGIARLGMRMLNLGYPSYFQKRNDWLMGYRVPEPPM